MSVIRIITGCWEINRQRTMATIEAVEKLPDPQKVLGWRPGPGRAHIAWQLMHVGITEELFATERLLGQPPEFAEFVPRFRGGSTPDDDIPSFDVIRQVLEGSRERLLTTVSTFSDNDLTTIPEHFRERGWTLDTILRILTWHEPHHQGQAHLTLNLFKAAEGRIEDRDPSVVTALWPSLLDPLSSILLDFAHRVLPAAACRKSPQRDSQKRVMDGVEGPHSARRPRRTFVLKSKLTIPWLAVCAAAGLCVFAIALPAQDLAPPPDGASFDEGGGVYEALARGPMHEAFANPYSGDPEPGIIIEEQPPEPIDELTPDQMPEGDNVVWIPGYWGWDPEEAGFIWISGLWRNVPGDSRWVPGYWARVSEGYQWVAGFWTNDDIEEIAYLPTPPESIEQGPNIAPPEGDYFWIPGSWIWQTSDYQWRPGYWAPAIAEWIWIPDQYVWTPYGCVFVPGRWDFDVIHRGVMFAPVAFRQPVYRQPNFRYTPTVVINSAPLLLHLFVSPGYSHYYYGNYYGYQPNNNFGFYPWYAYGHRRNVYDPLLTYYQWSYAQRDVNLIQRLSSWNGYFVQNQRFRPPRTFTAQRQFAQQFDRSDAPVQLAALTLASSLSNVASSNDGPFAFTQVAEPQRQRFAERSRSLRQFQRQRSEFEVAEAGSAAAQAPGEPRRGEEPRQGEEGRRREGPTAPQERKLQLPEATAVAQAEPTSPGEADAVGERDQPGRGRGERRRPPAPPTPDPSNAGRPEAAPGDSPPDRNRPGRNEPSDNRPDAPGTRPDAPGRGRPGAETPGDAQPGANLPGQGRPGNERPDADRPGDPGQPDSTPPGANRPDQGRPGGGRSDARLDRGRPGIDAGDDQGPAFPRFGVSRNRQPGDPGAAPGGAPGADAARPGAPNRDPAPGASQPGASQPTRGRGRGGFDPFDSRPPSAAGPDANAPGNRPDPGPEAGPPRGRRPDLAPGATVPGRGRPNLPEGAPALPGRGDATPPNRGNAGVPGGNPGAPGLPGPGNAGRPDRGGNPAAPGAAPRPTPGQAPSARPPAGAQPRPNPEAGAPKVTPGGGGRPQAAPGGGAPKAAPGGGGGRPQAAPGGGGGRPQAAPGGGGGKPPAAPGGGPPQPKEPDKDKKPKD